MEISEILSGKNPEKANSVILVKRYGNGRKPQKALNELRAHQIDNSPRLRAFSL